MGVNDNTSNYTDKKDDRVVNGSQDTVVRKKKGGRGGQNRNPSVSAMLWRFQVVEKRSLAFDATVPSGKISSA